MTGEVNPLLVSHVVQFGLLIINATIDGLLTEP